MTIMCRPGSIHRDLLLKRATARIGISFFDLTSTEITPLALRPPGYGTVSNNMYGFTPIYTLTI